MAVPTAAGYLVHRVGETAVPYWQRQHEHLQAYSRGEYPIYHAASLAAGRLNPIHRVVRGQNARMRMSWFAPSFHNKRKKLEAQVQATLALVAVFLAPLRAGVRLRRRIGSANTRWLRTAGRPESAVLETLGAPYRPLPAEPPPVVRSIARWRCWGWWESSRRRRVHLRRLRRSRLARDTETAVTRS